MIDMARINILDSENAVSEVVDVVLILGIMLIAITVISVAGFPALENMQESGHTENIRQSFIVLGENVNKVVFNDAPSQSVELKMYGGGIWITSSESDINVTMQTWNSTTSTPETRNFPLQSIGEIRNEFEGRSISYQNTGVWAKYETGESIAIREPQFVNSDKLLVIPVVKIGIIPGGNDGIAGEGLIRVVAKGVEQGTTIYKYQNVSAVDINVTSPYYDGWGNYLDETLGMKVDFNHTISTAYAQKNYTDENIDVYIVVSQLGASLE